MTVTDTAFEQAWTTVADSPEFPYAPEMLMPKRFWTPPLIDKLTRGVECWLTIVDDSKNYLYPQVDITTEGFEATSVLYVKALDIARAGVGIMRDPEREQSFSEQALGNFFPGGSEAFIQINQIPEMYRELVIRPASNFVKYQEAMGRVERVESPAEGYEPADAFWDAIAAFKDGVLPNDPETIVGNAEARLGRPLTGQIRTDLVSLAEQEIEATEGTTP